MTFPGDDDRDQTEALLDLFLYAPIGLALEASELIPKLAERGRGQIGLMRVAGTMAARHGGGAAEGLAGQFGEALTTLLSALGLDEPESSGPARGAKSGTEPFDGYDDLTVAEVLARLDDLDPANLAALRAHESAGRARVTILRRIDKLLA